MDPIQPIRLDGPLAAGRATSAPATGGAGFAQAMGNALEQVSSMQSESDRLAKEVQLDNPNVSLEESVLATQKASIAFQAVVQVRNRLVQAYQDIMNMPV
jgi:flagellar hook-basal body complex protein FliE